MRKFISLLHISILSNFLLSVCTQASLPIWRESHEQFLQCLLNYSIPYNHLYTPNTTSYSTVLESSIRNLRFNITSTPKPLTIVLPTQGSHVQGMVICSQTSGIQIRVRSGGHDYEGLSYVAYDRPFAILDLQKLSVIDIDDWHSTAWVQAGATVGELYYKIAEKNMTVGFPAGLCPTVGVGGHFSGGAIGTMMRKYGLAADNIVDARVVNANGEILDRASMGEDFFWAIRGGGAASFGVILAYKIKLVYVPPKVTVFTKPINSSQGAAIQVVVKWQQVAHKLDERLFIRQMSEVSNAQKANRTLQVSFQSLFLGEKQELMSVIEESFPELGLTEEDCQEMSWVESAKYFSGYANGDPLDVLVSRKLQFPYSYKAKSDFLTEPIPELGWQRIWEELLKGGEFVVMIVDPLGGKMEEIDVSETPFPHRKGSLYNIQYLVGWFEEGGKGDQSHIDWMRRFYKFMTPYVSKNPRAAYLNYRDLDLGSSYAGKASYSEASVWGSKYFKTNFRRLAMVKSKVDPANFFSNEQSIPTLIPF